MRKGIVLNYHTGNRFYDVRPDYCRATLILGGKRYLFDMVRLTDDGLVECMAFPCNPKNRVKSWTEVFCYRGYDDISKEKLMDCIQDFVERKRLA